MLLLADRWAGDRVKMVSDYADDDLYCECSEGGSFRDRIEADPQVKKLLSRKALDAAFDPARHTRHVDTIFKRVFAK